MVFEQGYPKTIIDTEVNSLILLEIKKPKANRISLVITYNPLLKGFAKVIKKHLHLLLMNDKFKKAFTPGPMVSFRGALKLSNYMLGAKLYPFERFQSYIWII